MQIYKRVTLSVFVVVVIISFANNAFSWGDVSKSKEFMQAGMYPQAIELLKKRINDKPADAEAHFQLGICFIHTGNYNDADERFGSAVRLESDYGYKIGGQYQKIGAAKLNKGQIQSAINLYNKAVSYQPGLKKEISMQCKTAGLAYLEKNKVKEATRLFRAAVKHQPQLKKAIARICFDKGTSLLNSMSRDIDSGKSETDYINRSRAGNAYNAFNFVSSLDSSWREKISDIYFDAGNKSEKHCFNFYRRAKEFSGKHNKEIGHLLAALAKTKGLSEKRQKEIKTEAARYLNEEEMLKAFPPDFKVYKPGDIQVFKLKKGEYSDHLIRPAWETAYEFQSRFGQYEVHYRDGRKFKICEGQKLPKINIHAQRTWNCMSSL